MIILATLQTLAASMIWALAALLCSIFNTLYTGMYPQSASYMGYGVRPSQWWKEPIQKETEDGSDPLY
ncbi:MAG: hypothetical protein PF904_18800 [Kiritimatiellae bacterium]|nr:hypothetical protein [Kiritimatiellia bacterium]